MKKIGKKLSMKKLLVCLVVLVGFSCRREDKIEPEAEEPMYVYVNSSGGFTYALDANTGEIVYCLCPYGGK